MRGFTDRALILLSDWDAYNESSSVYKYDYKLAVNNLLAYLQSVGIEHDCLISDQLATSLNMQDPRWLATGAPEDMFFMQNFCGVPAYDTVPLSQQITDTLRKKFPIERGMEAKERYTLVSKRVKFAEKEIIVGYQFVAAFGRLFNVKTKTGDGRAALHVGDGHFNTSLELSGESIPINGFFQVDYANQCLSEWGKYCGK